MPSEASAELIDVEVAYAKPEVQRLLQLRVPRGTTMVEAVRRSGIVELFPEIDPETAPLGIFGNRVKDRSRVLEPFDRVEIYRPLLHDPKEQRRQRARKEGRTGGRDPA
jgi:putative ubiquitin-RnfH superfamily antitoxin RatB of RatAB toxin-antitoxin module